MSFWIFQGNPDKFDASKYVENESRITWETNQFIKKVKQDDMVFIWRAQGRKYTEIPGVIAVAEVLDDPAVRPDDEAASKYYRTGDPMKPLQRVHLKIKKRLRPNEIVRKDWLEVTDATLRDLTIIKSKGRQTNYALTKPQADRLATLCDSVIDAASRQDFLEAPDDDPTKVQRTARRLRRGQDKFRRNLLDLYGGKRAITGWAPEAVLHAAHIVEHAIQGDNKADNGLLLRSDLHELFDDGLLRIDPKTYKVVVSDTLQNTPYWALQGVMLRPRRDGSQPGKKYLAKRWRTPILPLM